METGQKCLHHWSLTIMSMVACTSLHSFAHAQDAGNGPAGAPVIDVSAGAPNLNITPRRVVFDATKRTEAVYVFNQGTAPVTVDVALIDNVMLPSGEIVPTSQLATKGEAARALGERLRSARDMLLATPSRLTLLPGKGKAVRLRAALPDGAQQPGEWRSHLTVTTVPPPETGLTAENASAARPGELSFRIHSVFGISIPLIVRSGNPQATASIDAVSLEHTQAPGEGSAPPKRVPVLSLTLNRVGAASVFGNIEVNSSSDNSRTFIGFVRGISVYSEISNRRVTLPLTREPRPGEVLTLTYVSDDGQPRRVLAGGSISVR